MLHFAVNIWNGSIRRIPNRTQLDSTRTSSSIHRLDASRANDLIAFDKASNSAMSISAKKEKEKEREREREREREKERESVRERIRE